MTNTNSFKTLKAMSQPAPAAIQTNKALRTGHVIMADGSTTVPEKIELIKAGQWPATSVKGPLTITAADLAEFKTNFDSGVGMSKGLNQLPIDFAHADYLEAAGWITDLEIVNDTLVGSVTWSATGKTALEGGMYKCVSPSFYPGCLGSWHDPEDAEITATNVLCGAGLTNIPFFKSLTPLMASNTDKGTQPDNVIFIQAQKTKENPSMTLDELRVKEASALTADEKTFIEAHKAELSADEQTKFGLVEATKVTPTTKKEGEPVADPEMEAINASLKSGESVVVKASVWDGVQADLKAIKREKIEASVTKHLERGAIKADQIEAWADQIEANPESEKLLAALPDNSQMAASIGSEEAVNATSDALKQLNEKADAIVKASNNTIDPIAAFKQARSENPDLDKQLNEERE